MYIKFLGFNTAFSTVTLEIFKALKYLCYVLSARLFSLASPLRKLTAPWKKYPTIQIPTSR